MKAITLLLFTSFIFTGAFAQYAEIKNLADKDFEQKMYFEAAYNYKLLTDSSKIVKVSVPTYLGRSLSEKRLLKDRPYVFYRLAESYRLYQNYREAETWYARAIGENYESAYPLSRLWYGVCLRANKRFDQSVLQLQMFKAGFKGDAKFKALADQELAASTFARQQYALKSAILVTKINADWNNDGGNYALVKSNGDIWLTSTRYNANAKQYVNNIYKKNPANAAAAAGLAVSDKDANDVEYGTPSLSSSGKRIYLTAWRKDGAGKFPAIYSAENISGKWSGLKKLNNYVNADGYKAMQPRVTNDGKRLFYASNKPGGQGGLDLWVSILNSNGDPVNAVNLGSQVNSPADEEAPFYDGAKNRLVYSSKGFTGMGGFDLFESYGDTGRWSVPKNLGYPSNSTRDDLYYFADPENDRKAYISSDRESDCCLAVFELNYKPIEVRGRVASCDSDNVLQGARVTLLDSASKQIIGTTEAGIAGLYMLKAYERASYQLKFEKAGYFTKIIPVSLKSEVDTLYRSEICLQGFVLKKPIALKNILYDYNSATLRPESKAALDSLVQVLQDNPALKIELASHTDSVGTAGANLALSQLRAQACVNYVVSKGVAKERISAKGYGESVPVAPNSLPNGADNPAGRQLNRRTEFTILDK